MYIHGISNIPEILAMIRDKFYTNIFHVTFKKVPFILISLTQHFQHVIIAS